VPGGVVATLPAAGDRGCARQAARCAFDFYRGRISLLAGARLVGDGPRSVDDGHCAPVAGADCFDLIEGQPAGSARQSNRLGVDLRDGVPAAPVADPVAHFDGGSVSDLGACAGGFGQFAFPESDLILEARYLAEYVVAVRTFGRPVCLDVLNAVRVGLQGAGVAVAGTLEPAQVGLESVDPTPDHRRGVPKRSGVAGHSRPRFGGLCLLIRRLTRSARVFDVRVGLPHSCFRVMAYENRLP
jgi:hypothetical protein